jgi:serine/threonine-protein kinase
MSEFPDSSCDSTTARQPADVSAKDTALPSLGSAPLLSETLPDEKTVISRLPPLAAGAIGSPLPSAVLGSTLAGTQLEHYRLDEFVGGGGMGAVFRATDLRLGRTVAVKVLSRDHTDEETIRRFRNEAQSSARLDHPNIARVYYVGEDRGWNFIVFEFIAGTNLREEVERGGALALEQALHYTLQIAEALAHSSGRGIVHRDIKPSNVLVTATGQVKLVDMGLARHHQVDSAEGDLTASGVMLGTFDYISPEQARDPRAADIRSDIYSLGCTLFYMLTGQPPFAEGTALQKLLKHNSDDPPDVRSLRAELPARLTALLNKMLAKRPAQRHQSPAELMADIMTLGQQLGLKSIAEFGHVVLVPVGNPPSWRSAAWQIAAAVALFIMGLATIDFLSAPSQAGSETLLHPRFKPSAVAPAIVAPVRSAAKSASAAESPAPAPASAPTAAMPEATGATAPDEPGGSSVAGQQEPPFSPGGDVPGASSAASRPTALESSGHEPGDLIAPPKPQHLVLGDSPPLGEPLTEFVGSLAEACARASDLGITEIELRFNGERIEQPLEIANSRLKLRSALDFRPQIVFRPEVGMGELCMIRLAGGSSAHLQCEGIDLRLELPLDAPADGWSLFGLGTGQSLDLTSCILTVQDGDSGHLPIHEAVAFITVQRRRANDAMTMADSQLAMGQQAQINLERTIARGEASLISLTEETPLTIRWNQGLLITPQHLIETGGSATEPQYYEQIVLDLDSVTAYCRGGLYSLRRGPGKAYQFHVNANANHCVFVSEAGAPLFEMTGLAAPPEEDELKSTGEGNRFSPAEMPFLVFRTMPMGEPQIFKLGRRWSSETRSQAGVPWVHAPPLDRPRHELTKQNFLIEDDSLQGGTGFDPLLLPDAWSASEAAPPSANPPPAS